MVQVAVVPVVLGGRRLNCKWKGRKEITPRSVTFSSSRNVVAAAKSSFRPSSRKARERGKRDIFIFSCQFCTDIPFIETSGVSMDEYLHNHPRIVHAIFPDQRQRTKLSDEEWKLELVPIQFLFLAASPVVVMSFISTSNREEYPSNVPNNATSVLEIKATDCGLVGLNSASMPTHLALTVQGALYPHRKHGQGNLKGNVDISIGFDLPPALALIPENILRGVGETVLKHLAERLKHDLDTGLAADFKKFRREKLMENGAAGLSSKAEKYNGGVRKLPKQKT